MAQAEYIKETFRRHQQDMREAYENTPLIVFLCGPSLKDLDNSVSKEQFDPAVLLRAKIRDELESNGFGVVLGEDDGLEDIRLQITKDAQNNELQYISKYCNAIIIVTASAAVGAFCELGLFSWHFAHPDGLLNDKKAPKDFILLAEKRYESQESYFNEGPAKIVPVFGGKTEFADYRTYDVQSIINRLQLRKSTFASDGRGRPRSES